MIPLLRLWYLQLFEIDSVSAVYRVAVGAVLLIHGDDGVNPYRRAMAEGSIVSTILLVPCPAT